MEFKNEEDPVQSAIQFSDEKLRGGFLFDFSLKSLECEVDKYLETLKDLKAEQRVSVAAGLTAYVGETICKLFGGKWVGSYFSSKEKIGRNFYFCKILVNGHEIFPSHFISYYLSNGKNSEGSFFDYLYARDQSKGAFKDFLGGGLLNKLLKENLIYPNP
ncbi:hypothetical protein ABIB40_001385 [Pedobacter sp. UYP30]|uniref:hypothetical protein n=1 Tax=Pedobacter sp. UYP30 TaxID=1756400 RepID=UPI0033907A0A